MSDTSASEMLIDEETDVSEDSGKSSDGSEDYNGRVNEMSTSVSESNGKHSSSDGSDDDFVQKPLRKPQLLSSSDSEDSEVSPPSSPSTSYPIARSRRGHSRAQGRGGWSRRGRPIRTNNFDRGEREATRVQPKRSEPKMKTPIIKLPRLDAILGLELLNVPLGHLYMSIDSFSEAYTTYVRETEKKNRLRPRRQRFQASYREFDDFSSCSEYVPSSGSEEEAQKAETLYDLTSSDEDWIMGRNESVARNTTTRRRRRGANNRVTRHQKLVTVKDDVDRVNPPSYTVTTVSSHTKAQLCNVLAKPSEPAPDKVKIELEMREFVTKIMNGDCIYKDFVIWLNLNPLTMVRLECSPKTLPPTKSYFVSLQNSYKTIYCALCAGSSPEESKLLEDYDDWLRHWREEHNMSRNIHCCKCNEKFGCFPEFLHHMMTAKGGRTPHSALNCAYLYETVFLAGSPNNENWFRCPRDNCSVEGSSWPVLAHIRLNHRNLGFTLNRCDLAPCESHPLRSVADLVDHLRKNHESLLMDQSTTKRAEMNILAHRSKSKETQKTVSEPQRPPESVNIPSRGRPSLMAKPVNIGGPSNVYILPKSSSHSQTANRPTSAVVQAALDELYICGVCKAEHTAVSLMTCHQQHAHTFRMPVHCNKCSMPLPQIWSVIKQHYEKGHAMVFQTSRLLPFVYKRPVYFLKNSNSNRSMCSRCRASVLIGGELEHVCASDNKWHATGPPSRCGLCTENFMEHLTMDPVREHYLRKHSVCIVCLKKVEVTTVAKCSCEEEHWKKEEEAKSGLLKTMMEHIEVLKTELDKKNSRKEPMAIVPPVRGRKGVERMDVTENTIKEAKRVIFVLDTNKYPMNETEASPTSGPSNKVSDKETEKAVESVTAPLPPAEEAQKADAAATAPVTSVPEPQSGSQFLDFRYACTVCHTPSLSLADFVQHRLSSHSASTCCPSCPRVKDLEAEKAREHILALHHDVGNFLPSQWPPSWHPFIPAPPANEVVVTEGPPLSPEGPIFCLYCRQFAGGFHQLLMHMAVCHHSAALRFRCVEPCAPQAFPGLKAVEDHVRVRHYSLRDQAAGCKAKYVCLTCEGKVENDFVGALAHLRSIHGLRDFFFHCPICPFVLLGGERTLKLHLRRYHGPTFADAYDKGALLVHFENMENLIAAVQPSRFTTNAHGTFMCGPCGRKEVFASDGDLLLHSQARHRGRNAMVCPVCRDLFLDRQKLRVHMDAHVKEFRDSDIACQLRWVCQIDECSFSVKHVLRDMALHSETVHGLTPEAGDIIVRCPFCRWLQSSDMNAVIRHLRIFHLVGVKKLGLTGVSIQPVAVRGKCSDEELPFRGVVENVRLPMREAGSDDLETNAAVKKKGRVKESPALRKTTNPPITYELSSDDDEEEKQKETKQEAKQETKQETKQKEEKQEEEEDNGYKIPVVSKFNVKGYEHLSWDSDEGIALLAAILMERSSNGQPFNIPDPQMNSNSGARPGKKGDSAPVTRRRSSGNQKNSVQMQQRQRVEMDQQRLRQIQEQYEKIQMEDQQRRQQLHQRRQQIQQEQQRLENQKRLQQQQQQQQMNMPRMQIISDQGIPQQLVQLQPGQIPATSAPILAVDPRSVAQLGPQQVQFVQRAGQELIFAPTVVPQQPSIAAQARPYDNQMLR